MTAIRPEAQLVVVGSSAGGIEALSTLVASLPDDFPAPMVLAQHLDPTRESHLEEILQRRTRLPVRTVSGTTQLEPGVIYVVPSNRHVEVADRTVTVHEHTGRAGRAKPSVDLLLSTAADVYGEGLVAVILSGMGSDGASGVRDVKNGGGTVIVQNPETAAFPSMPGSLPPALVDIVANVEAIGAVLHALLTGAYFTQRPEDDASLRSLLEQLRERSGIDFSAYKRTTIMRRLQRRMAATGTQRLRDYLRHLQNEPDEYQRLVASFLIKVTEFFRDAEMYAYLRERVLPTLVAEARDRGRELRLWSAGCATGEEAYSLAILVLEALGDEIGRFNVRIFATDLDNDAVSFARRGIYPASAVGMVEPALLERYFTRVGDEYEVKKPVRALTVFGQHDLGQRAPFPRIDLALCRNVLIYFTPELQKRALQLFAFSLRDGGYLVLGKAETATPLAEFFTLEQARLKVYRRQGSRVLIPPSHIRETVPNSAELVPLRFPGLRRSLSSPEALRQARDQARVWPRWGRAENVLLHLPTGVVQVDRNYDILSINNAARRLLGIHGGAIGNDFIHEAQRLPPTQLRGLIDRAFRKQTGSQVFQTTATDRMPGEARHLRLTAELNPGSGDEQDCVIIVVEDITAIETRRLESEASYLREKVEAERLSALLEEAYETTRRLAEANEELNTTNAELRSANEELLVANEEVQAATEEVETLNEEMQASNEELETLNEEMQAAVEELNTTNDDLQARSLELEELATTLEQQRLQAEAQRQRLAAVLASMSDAVLVFDQSGRCMLTNAAADTMFAEVGGPEFIAEDLAGRPLPLEESPRRRAARGETFILEFSLTLPSGKREHFEARGQPSEGGGVVVIRHLRAPRAGGSGTA